MQNHRSRRDGLHAYLPIIAVATGVGLFGIAMLFVIAIAVADAWPGETLILGTQFAQHALGMVLIVVGAAALVVGAMVRQSFARMLPVLSLIIAAGLHMVVGSWGAGLAFGLIAAAGIAAPLLRGGGRSGAGEAWSAAEAQD